MSTALSRSSKWATKPLAETFEIVGGGTPSKQEASYYGGDIPWATIRDMASSHLSSTEHSITNLGLAKSSSKLIPAGEVIMATRVGLGKACILLQDTAINQDIRALIPRQGDAINRNFLLYWLESMAGEITASGTGATVQGVTLPFIKGLPFPSVPVEQQKRVVAVLDQAFAALDRARANAEANLADAEAVFERALLATFDELLTHASMTTLAEMSTDFSRGKSKHRPRNDPKLYGGAYPFIQTGDVRRAEGAIREYSQTYNHVGLAQSKLWPAGTVCITIAANIAETGVLEFEACFPDSVIGMVPDPERAMSYYVEYMLRYFSKELKLKGKGSAQDNINLATFEDSMFPFPSLAEQVAIVDKLNDLSKDVPELRSLYGRQIGEIDALRQSLLQTAFSGQMT